MDDHDDPRTAALSMPSLLDLQNTLEALLQTPHPPRSLFMQASSNVCLLGDMIRSALPGSGPLSDAHARSSSAQPCIQDLLPQAVIVDCAQVASTKALYGRILNGLSGWGRGEWSNALGGVLNWDGRMEGYTIQQDPQSREWQLNWDYSSAVEHSNSKNTSSSKLGIIDRKDESFSAFIDGLKTVFTLGGEEEQDELERTTQSNQLPKPRFVVLLNAERIPELESLPVGQNESTLLASFMRIAELTGKPIVPVMTSQSEWLLLRPQRGATEPGVTLQLPSLKRQDIVHYLLNTCSRDLPTSSNLTSEQQTTLLTSLADLIHQTFEPYLGDELSDYLWLMERLWLDWRRPVETGAVQAGDINRLVALFKNVLSREIESLGGLRPLQMDEEQDFDTGLEEIAPRASTSASSTQGTPKKFSSASAFYANSSINGSPLAGFSPSYNSITPSKRTRTESGILTSSMQSNNNNNINDSLSILSKYILIASFLASSNPSKKDVLMLATKEDDLALSKRKKKGGAMRKTPNKRSNNINIENEVNGPIRRKDTILPQRMSGPKPFPLERLIAITETILPVELRSLAKSQDILQEIASLTSLKLLLKTSSSASLSTYPTFTSSSSSSSYTGIITISPFDKSDGIKLKCSTMLELEFIESLAKSIGLKVSERLWETFT